MKFTLLAAADIYGQKVNLELDFANFPSIAEVTRLVEAAFAAEVAALRPAAQPSLPFDVDRIQLFDDRLGGWIDLLTSSQLVDKCQIYAFPRESVGSEAQGPIPPPRVATITLRRQSSPARPGSSVKSPPRAVAAAADVSPYAAHYQQHPSWAADVRSPAAALGAPPAVPGVSPIPAVIAMVSSPARHRDPAAVPVSPTRRSSRGAPAPATVNARFPPNPSLEVKLRATFEALDRQVKRVLTADDFAAGLAAIDLRFSPQTLADLFARADGDRDGVVSFAEFQAFAAAYPALNDAVYYRLRERFGEQQRAASVAAQEAAVEDARRREEHARALQAEAQAAAERQTAALDSADRVLGDRLQREKEVRGARDEARRAAETQRAARVSCEAELVAFREAERQRRDGAVDTERATVTAEGQLRALEGEAVKSQERIRQLEAMLAEARLEAERAGDAVRMAADDVQQRRQRHSAAQTELTAAQEDVRRSNDAVAVADRELATVVQQERDAEGALEEARRESAAAAQGRDEQERDLVLQSERAAHHQQLTADAGRLIEDQRRCLQQLAEDHQLYLERRRTVESQEQPLLEQEVKLREQRFSLEEREGRLRTDAATFAASSGRAMHPAAVAGGSPSSVFAKY